MKSFDGIWIFLIGFTTWFAVMIVMLLMGLSSCTFSVNLINNHGNATDMLDATSSSETTIPFPSITTIPFRSK